MVISIFVYLIITFREFILISLFERGKRGGEHRILTIRIILYNFIYKNSKN
jgi:hypothetical protein